MLKKPKKRTVLLIVLGSLLVLPLLGVSSGQGEKVEYLTEAVRVGNLVKTVIASGEIGAVQLVSVGAQVSGQIQTLHVSLGQMVKKGDLIAEIDSTAQKSELAINQAKLETYQAQLASQEITLKVARAQYDRELALKGKGSTTAENLDQAEDALAAAQARLNELKSLIKQTRIAAETAEVNLGYTRIEAPLSGTVVSIAVEEGQTVNAVQSAPTIAQIADLSQMEIKMQISEGDITKVKPGMKVTYTILSEPGRGREGALEAIDPGLTLLTDGSYSGSAGSNSAVYYYGKLTVDNRDNTLRIGMTTRNTITVAQADRALMVPTQALSREMGLAFLSILEADGRVIKKQVETGLADSLYTQVLDGVSEGERVIIAQANAADLKKSGLGSGPPPMM